MRTTRLRKVTPDEYLSAEIAGGARHEYVAGERFPLAEPSRPHQLAVQNLFLPVAERLVAGPRTAYTGIARVRVEAADVVYYPDVVVDDGSGEDSRRWLERPLLVAEVAGLETAPIDFREKWLVYQLADSIREVVLLDLVARTVDVRRRARGDASWTAELYERGEKAWLDTVELTVPVDDVYAGLDGLSFA